MSLAACGSSGGGASAAGTAPTAGGASTSIDQDQIRSTLTRDIDSLASGDGAVTCAQMTAAGQRAAAAVVPGGSCENTIRRLHALMIPAVRRELRAARVTEVDVMGTRASAKVSSANANVTVRAELRKVKGTWLVAQSTESGT